MNARDAASAAALHLARRADAVIGAALLRRWPLFDPGQVTTRVTVISAPDGDTYYLDGVEFLWMGKPVITQDDDGTISVARQWREAPLRSSATDPSSTPVNVWRARPVGSAATRSSVSPSPTRPPARPCISARAW